ncbi:ammonium transporter (ISS) [Ectocarpus siliculosus]|uniref:Ammonium transporter n=1 Tax=Ectocarpus siliculosus TaxID=2880 RepID=D7G243_ECTSI|nr:ammonium transporter (ISS) [Ectocarpus siliculosus]|eukprot:CBJ33346.1 ammonium transporter (ISS) [Ectocarpus siliculosus]
MTTSTIPSLTSSDPDYLLQSATLGDVASLAGDMDIFWLLFGAILVFFMQTGFAMLEVGSVSIKNTKNILIKNIGDASLGAICWWLFGYGVALGDTKGRFIGSNAFALKGSHFEADDGTLTNGYSYAMWLFQWAFAATAATIVSGAVAERVSFNAYIIYSVILTSFIYPVVVHWGWGGGWASAWVDEDLLFDCGVIDFAGSGVVHMTGGLAALAAAIVVGPRTGRFNEDGTANTLPQQSAVLQTLGTLILWFGWYGFNGVSTLAINGLAGVAAKTMVTTTISAAFGAVTTVLLGKLNLGYWDAGAANNGLLAGLVGVTAGCSTCEPEGAMVIGIISGFVYTYSSKMLVMLKIDDVVDAIPVHCFCGAWGVFAASLFATKDNYSAAYYGDRVDKCAGAFYGGDGNAVAANVVFILAVIAWVSATCMALFLGINAVVGMRVDKEMEQIGMDDSKHGGQTYPEMVKGATVA